MSQEAIATAVCQINLTDREFNVEVRGWPKTLLQDDGQQLELEGRLFSSGAREVVLHRGDGFARFLLVSDSAELLVQEAPGLQPVRTLTYALEEFSPSHP